MDIDLYKRVRSIALYASFKNEVLTDEVLLDALERGKEVFYPKVIRGKGGLGFVRVNGKDELEVGSYDIPEPRGKGFIEKPLVGLVVVPGVVFDVMGNRLGYGKGYYDRTLALLVGSVQLVSLAFDFQVVEGIPTQPHDMRVDWVITEKRVIECKPQPVDLRKG